MKTSKLLWAVSEGSAILPSNTILIDQTQDMKDLLHLVPQEAKYNIIYVSQNAYQLAGFISQSRNFPITKIYCKYIKSPVSDTKLAVVDEFGNITVDKNSFYSFDIDDTYITSQAQEIEQSLKKQAQKRQHNIEEFVENQNILLVKEYMESGLKTLCVLETLKKLGAKNIDIATIAIPNDLLDILNPHVTKIYSNHILDNFITSSYHLQYNKKINQTKEK